MATTVSADVSAPSTGERAGLTVTERALRRVEVLLEREGIAGGALRVGLRGGGCAGFEYTLKLEAGEPRPDDTVVGTGNARVVVDPRSLRLLTGAVLDFTEGLDGKGFAFENPHAVRTCGCGTSFSA
ncbi:MAG: HesB/IscA family protein [Gemmatimonadota bacterium]